MIASRIHANWRKLADKIALSRCTFAIRNRGPHVGFMQDDHLFGRPTRNPSPFWGLAQLRSAPTFLARMFWAPAPQLSLIPVKHLPNIRPGFARKTGGLPDGNTAYSRRTNHV